MIKGKKDVAELKRIGEKEKKKKKKKKKGEKHNQ